MDTDETIESSEVPPEQREPPQAPYRGQDAKVSTGMSLNVWTTEMLRFQNKN